MEDKFKKECDSNLKTLEANLNEIKKGFAEKGYYMAEKLFSKDYCQRAIDLIDRIDTELEVSGRRQEGKEINYGGSELRIWQSEKMNPLFMYFKEVSDGISSQLFDKPMEAFNVLAIRNRALDLEDLKQFVGRWHLDSFKKQFKAFLFLTDTKKESGPFEFLPGTQRSSYKNQLLIQGKVITLSDLFSGKRAYQKIADDFVEKLTEKYPSKEVIVPAGTLVLVDTSAIHRAKPCLEGHRYALTSYYK